MTGEDGRAHICSVGVHRPAEDAMAFLMAPENLSSWAAGMGRTRIHADGMVEGAFPDTGQPIWARIDADLERFAIYYHVGPDRDALVPRIMVRVVPGTVLDGAPRTCVVSLIAWRQATMDDARWEGLQSGHEREIREIKRLVESPAHRDTK